MKIVSIEDRKQKINKNLKEIVWKVSEISSKVPQNSKLKDFSNILLSKCPFVPENTPETSSAKNTKRADLSALHKQLKTIIFEQERIE